MFLWFSTHTRQSCGAVVAYRSPRRSLFRRCQFYGFVHFVHCYEASPRASLCWRTGRADGEDLWVLGGCAGNGETFSTEVRKQRSPFGLSSLAFRKHSPNRLRGAAGPSQSLCRVRAVRWHRKLLRTAQMPAPELCNCLGRGREHLMHHSAEKQIIIIKNDSKIEIKLINY